MSKQSYTSIITSSAVEIKEKGSKFIGMAVFCKTEAEVKSTLEAWHEEHPSATHICYGYRLGIEGDKTRANDDGEPNNSAGAPILGQIMSAEITNVLVGVVRYYGGTKLGVGGLIQAYKLAAKEVLSGSKKKRYRLADYFKIDFSYAEMPLVMNVLKRNQIEIVRTEINAECFVVVKCGIVEPVDVNGLLAMYSSVKIEFIERK